jgi:hypothetical protein
MNRREATSGRWSGVLPLLLLLSASAQASGAQAPHLIIEVQGQPKVKRKE